MISRTVNESVVKLAYNVYKRQENLIIFLPPHIIWGKKKIDGTKWHKQNDQMTLCTACSLLESLRLHIILYNVVSSTKAR